jgi:hypothetical protein
VAEHAIIIGVKWSFIISPSLEHIKLGLYNNKVQWIEEARVNDITILLYNGNP